MDTMTDVLVKSAQVVLAPDQDFGQILLDKINTRHATLAVIGVGYVGLPLAISFAESGLTGSSLPWRVRETIALKARTPAGMEVPPLPPCLDDRLWLWGRMARSTSAIITIPVFAR